MKGLDDGNVNLHIIKCGVSGPPETGKTHVRALMLGQERPLERKSTAIAAEADQVTPDYRRVEERKISEDVVNVKTTRKGEVWKIIKDDSMVRFISNTLHNGYYKKGNKETTGEPPLQSLPKKRCKFIKKVEKRLKEMQGKPRRKATGLNDIRLVYFVDTGGQPQFMEILPNFIRCDINLLVHNLSQSLDYCPEFSYVAKGKSFTVSEEIKLSNGEIIEQSVRSITSSISTSDSKACVAIIGTFKDKCEPHTEEYKKMLREKSKEINERLHPYIGEGVDKCSMFSPQRSQDQRIFAIDGSEQGWDKNIDTLEFLKKQILNSVKERPVEVPIRYFLFLQSSLKQERRTEKISMLHWMNAMTLPQPIT